jgi:hypothetical protein
MPPSGHRLQQQDTCLFPTDKPLATPVAATSPALAGPVAMLKEQSRPAMIVPTPSARMPLVMVRAQPALAPDVERNHHGQCARA